ncbi:hypothetical protein [Pseudomonas izuensis]|uniref:hypothetical protein n=1 Tax=Pseudomonas izuensis TaxID=2684212 RepID=UPI001FEC85BA|nr:hypothetical protein [Pseudomonas izuensis]
MSWRQGIGRWRFGSGLLLLIVLILGTHQIVESLSQEPIIALEVGGTYETLRKNSSVPFSPMVRGHVWMGLPKTDARLRLIDPQYEFLTPRARFFTVVFDDTVVSSIRMSPQLEPLLLDDALKVALDLQEQWLQGGWRVAGRTRYPPFVDTPEWRARLRDVNKGGTVYWKAGEKYQVTMFMNRFKCDKRPDEERYLITLSIGKPWTPFEEDGDEEALIELDQSNPVTPLFPTKTKGAPPCQPPRS